MVSEGMFVPMAVTVILALAFAFHRRAWAGEQKATLAREFGISRETLYQYLNVAPVP